MKTIVALFAALMLTLAPVKETKASDITTSVVVGVLVAQYVGTLAGVAASSVMAGTAVLIHSAGKEAALKAAQNDVANFEASGNLSLSLQNSVNTLKALDSSVSDSEAMDMILEALKS